MSNDEFTDERVRQMSDAFNVISHTFTGMHVQDAMSVLMNLAVAQVELSGLSKDDWMQFASDSYDYCATPPEKTH